MNLNRHSPQSRAALDRLFALDLIHQASRQSSLFFPLLQHLATRLQPHLINFIELGESAQGFEMLG